MAKPRSESWDAQNLAHRYTVSFFASEYGDKPISVTGSNLRENRDLLYFNVADHAHDISAILCAGLMVTYMQAQGIPYHTGKGRDACFAVLSQHLKDGTGKVLLTADIVDDHFRFLNETVDG